MDVENIDNWNWFLDLLVDDLDLGSGNGLVVISDQHKVYTKVFQLHFTASLTI